MANAMPVEKDISVARDFFKSINLIIQRKYSDIDAIYNRIDSIIDQCIEDVPLDKPIWLNFIFLSFYSGAIDLGIRLSEHLISRGHDVERLTAAVQLARQGEIVQAAYVASGSAAYNERYAEVSPQSFPPVALEQILDLPRTARVLDVGCGTGLIGQVCRSAGYSGYLAGVDLVAEMTDAVPPGVYDGIAVADAFQWLESNDEQWDAVLSFGLFVHFDLKAAARMISLVSARLKPNGFFAFNALETRELFSHSLPSAVAMVAFERSGLELEAMVRREERTTYICRKV